MLPNASYFAFTATPKNKTLETFGTSYTEGGESKHRPFHSYTMKQAIGEGYILDVLARYVPVDSYYRLVKTVEDDPEFDSRRAAKKLRAYVEGHEHAIRTKAQIIVDHFHGQVIAEHKIAGKARAMVVTASIERAIQYYDAICAALRERKSPYRAIVAFSGTHEYAGQQATEAAVNGFPSKDIPDVFVEDPYRILVCADKFQTGYDEPLLHTMYVDKPLSGIKAVQTLSRLNRANPAKHDTAVLDFANDTGTIEKSFEPYYRTTVLTGETDPDKLHDLAAELTRHGVFSADHVEKFAELYLGSAPREQLDPILDGCAAAYVEELDEDDQVAFKSAAKAFTRAYGFLSGILPYSNAEWEKLSMFCENLIPKLPTPREDDLSAGILETIDMESYRVEKRAAISLALADKEGDVEPVPTSAAAGKAEPELEQLSHIVLTFNERFGNIEWSDEDRIRRLIAEDIPRKLSADEAYRNAQANSDRQNARVESDRALAGVMLGLMRDDSELYKQYSDNEDFRRWLADVMFETTYKKSA
jgi:type I restriction enzyme R subunit